MNEEENRYWSKWCGTYVNFRRGDIADNPIHPWTNPALSPVSKNNEEEEPDLSTSLNLREVSKPVVNGE